MTIDKVDIVYTWVDGLDPVWQEKKESYLHSEDKYQQCQDNQISDKRYIEHDELKYSLRSICKFAPWVNHIYIITDNQAPFWLKRSDKVTIVDHKDIIPEEFLPTFNSSVIESFLHKIPNLSENFIYFNDDVMLGKNTNIIDFFKAKYPIVFTSSIFPSNKKARKTKESTYNMLAISSSREIVHTKASYKVNYGFRHGVRILNKSRYHHMFEKYKEYIYNNFNEKFRLTPFSLIYIYLFNEIAENKVITKYQKNLKRDSIFNIFPTFTYVNNNNIDYFSSNFKNLSPLVFCINETNSPLENLSLFSNGALSEKSEFEL